MTIDELIEQARTAREKRNVEALLRWKDQLDAKAAHTPHAVDAIYVKSYAVRAHWRNRSTKHRRMLKRVAR